MALSKSILAGDFPWRTVVLLGVAAVALAWLVAAFILDHLSPPIRFVDFERRAYSYGRDQIVAVLELTNRTSKPIQFLQFGSNPEHVCYYRHDGRWVSLSNSSCCKPREKVYSGALVPERQHMVLPGSSYSFQVVVSETNVPLRVVMQCLRPNNAASVRLKPVSKYLPYGLAQKLFPDQQELHSEEFCYRETL